MTALVKKLDPKNRYVPGDYSGGPIHSVMQWSDWTKELEASLTKDIVESSLVAVHVEFDGRRDKPDNLRAIVLTTGMGSTVVFHVLPLQVSRGELVRDFKGARFLPTSVRRVLSGDKAVVVVNRDAYATLQLLQVEPKCAVEAATVFQRGVELGFISRPAVPWANGLSAQAAAQYGHPLATQRPLHPSGLRDPHSEEGR